jgi:hypothetical protein
MWQHKKPNSGNDPGTGEGNREYVNVVADYSVDGIVKPVSIRFADGPSFNVERIISMVHMSSTKFNGAETRYYVRIGDREHYLFFEDAQLSRAPRWFVVD